MRFYIFTTLYTFYDNRNFQLVDLNNDCMLNCNVNTDVGIY